MITLVDTFVPQPNKKPTPNVDAMEGQEFGPGGYVGSKDGANKYIGAALETRPAIMGRLLRLGLKTHPEMSEEIPNTAPL